MNSIEKVVELLKKNAPAAGDEVHEQSMKPGDFSSPGVSSNKETLEIDLNRLKENGYITPDTRDTVKAEEFRVIKRPILRNAFGKGAVDIPNGNMIMVTSSLPGEGKTFTSLSLAMSMALELDTTVLLVDCDVINPSLSRLLEIEDYIGLTDFLKDSSVELQDTIINTSIPRLRLLPSGSRQSQSNELLNSARMSDLIKELSERYTDRVVLFDTPPLLLANQARVLTQLMGQVIVVVEAEKTPQGIVKEAIGMLEQDKAVGVVLNKTRKVSGGNYYGSYYAPSEK